MFPIVSYSSIGFDSVHWPSIRSFLTRFSIRSDLIVSECFLLRFGSIPFDSVRPVRSGSWQQQVRRDRNIFRPSFSGDRGRRVRRRAINVAPGWRRSKSQGRKQESFLYIRWSVQLAVDGLAVNGERAALDSAACCMLVLPEIPQTYVGRR